jgi:hypothetical protein
MAIKQLDWSSHLGFVVRVYRNLNNGAMSIQVKDGRNWRVVGHVTQCVVSNVTFKVQEGCRQRVIRDGRKNVHAWGQGVLVCEQDDRIIAPLLLGYNPYTDATFLDKASGSIVTHCQHLVVRDNVVFVSPDAITSEQDSRSIIEVGSRLMNLFNPYSLAFAA